MVPREWPSHGIYELRTWFQYECTKLLNYTWVQVQVLQTLSLDELALFVFKLLVGLVLVLTSSYDEITWVWLLSSFALPWNHLLASLLEFNFFQAFLYLDIIFWRAYLSWNFCTSLECHLLYFFLLSSLVGKVGWTLHIRDVDSLDSILYFEKDEWILHVWMWTLGLYSS